MSRRRFVELLGSSALAALVSEFFPLEDAKAMAKETGPIEKKDLSIGFIPITCATPIIMAEPMGFYEKHGLNAKVRKAAGWAMVRDWAITKEVDAAHMLSPMPLSITLGAGSKQVPYYMPAVENINGQAITLANKHKGVKGAAGHEGLPLLRALRVLDAQLPAPLLPRGGRHAPGQGRADPRRAAARDGRQPEGGQRRRLPRAGSVQPACGLRERRLHLQALEGDLGGAPLLRVRDLEGVREENPNTFIALFRRSSMRRTTRQDKSNRKGHRQGDLAEELPEPAGDRAGAGAHRSLRDGKGGIQNVPDRIDFDPFPWHSMAVWILTQMKRWKHVDRDFDYQQVAKEVYLATQCAEISKELGYSSYGTTTYEKHVIMGKEFDPDEARGIRRELPDQQPRLSR